MNQRHVKILIGGCLTLQSAIAAEPLSKAQSAGEFVVENVAEAPQVFAIACADGDPATKAKFNKAIDSYRAKVQQIGGSLLASDLFASLSKVPPPQEAIDAVPVRKRDLEEQAKRVKISGECPIILGNIQNTDAEMLKAGLANSLSAMQGLIAGMKAGVLK